MCQRTRPRIPHLDNKTSSERARHPKPETLNRFVCVVDFVLASLSILIWQGWSFSDLKPLEGLLYPNHSKRTYKDDKETVPVIIPTSLLPVQPLVSVS